jgi:hypothetical protein
MPVDVCHGARPNRLPGGKRSNHIPRHRRDCGFPPYSALTGGTEARSQQTAAAADRAANVYRGLVCDQSSADVLMLRNTNQPLYSIDTINRIVAFMLDGPNNVHT